MPMQQTSATKLKYAIKSGLGSSRFKCENIKKMLPKNNTSCSKNSI